MIRCDCENSDRIYAEFRSQNSPLLPSQLAVAYRHLVSAKRVGRSLLSFYNCGPLSGASQPHQHIQLIPVDADGPPIDRLARKQMLENQAKAFSIPTLPFANFVRRLSTSNLDSGDDAMEDYLGKAFMNLLDLTIATIRHDPDYPAGPPSYNVLMTLDHMFIFPRRQEEYMLCEGRIKLPVNSLGYSGMFLVKCEDELQAVKDNGIVPILAKLALPKLQYTILELSQERGTGAGQNGIAARSNL